MQPFIFNQIHIDAARNATDDFNLFHDKNKWCQISKNPFEGPIVLGFQLESLIEYNIKLYRKAHNEEKILTEEFLFFSNYQFSFANAVKPDHVVSIDIKPSKITEGNFELSNRISVKSEGKLDLVGFKKETQTPLFLPDTDTSYLGDLKKYNDRSYIDNGAYFIKRKFMNTSNAKNFLSGSLAEQSDYFDELEGKANFPEIFPCGLISCALLEKAVMEKHDFEKNPMVYTAHKISIDRRVLAGLKSNDTLHILVKQPQDAIDINGCEIIGKSDRRYKCYGIVGDHDILFRGLITLTYLRNILDSINKNGKS